MVLKYRYLGKGYTDENGIAHMTEDADGQAVTGYTGTGRGKTDIIASTDDAEHISDSSLLSEIYEVIDGMFYDEGVSGNHKTTSTTQSTGSWYNGSGNLTVEYSDNGTIVTHGEDNTTARHLFYNDTVISTVKLNGMNTILNNSAIEFDITAFTGTPQIYFTDGTNNKSLNIPNTGHYKIVFDGSVIKQYINNVEIPLNNYMMTGDNIRFSFILNEKDESFTFKNLVIYPI